MVEQDELLRVFDRFEKLSNQRASACKTYYNKNKEKYKISSANYYNKHKDNVEWKEKNNEKNRNYYNKCKLTQDKITCECGSVMMKQHKKRHDKEEKHVAFLILNKK